MSKLISFYLDLLRVVAAFGVLFVHCNLAWFSNNKFLPPQLGHKLVMVFFVLSGYLIAFSTIGKHKSMKDYFIDRFSRLYSVVIPALLLTYFLDFFSRNINPSLFSEIPSDRQFLKFLMNLFFIHQIWDFSTKPSSNGAFWSLSYEFWYYCIYGFLFFLKGYKRIVTIALTLLLIGPKIILLLPVWLYGVISFYLSKRIQLKSNIALFIFLISFFVIIYDLITDNGSNMQHFGTPPLYFSTLFLEDWLFGLLVAANLLSISFINVDLKIPASIVKCITYFSSISFSLYLYHIPFLYLAAATKIYDKVNYFHLYTIVFIIIILICFLANYTESKRYLYKDFIRKVVDFINLKLLSIKTLTEVK